MQASPILILGSVHCKSMVGATGRTGVATPLVMLLQGPQQGLQLGGLLQQQDGLSLVLPQSLVLLQFLAALLCLGLFLCLGLSLLAVAVLAPRTLATPHTLGRRDSPGMLHTLVEADGTLLGTLGRPHTPGQEQGQVPHNPHNQ